MNPKRNVKNKFYGGNKSRNDKFRGHKGKVRKKQLYNSKTKSCEVIDEEIEQLKSKYHAIETIKLKKFSDFPLSGRTLQGLKQTKFDTPTEIQRESIGLALQGNDILGAAKTGSGKTLAFLIPVLECLFRLKWSPMDGLGALIISPTRELAYQTFEVLKRVGKAHDFSAGLVIGGKLLKEESARINRTNIVICTPGRLLQHMDETANFTADNLQILVLDEADRILDLGFARDMNAIIENLPSSRQTLLFSATQTKSVKDLARLSLQNPMYVSVHENAQHSTPVQLEQNYIVCELHDKMSMLWSFIKNHLKCKVLVFFTSCKQVRYVYECIKRLRPGVTVLSLHGSMNQLKRVAVYNQFCRKQHAVLFATDVAARGLDFPAVNWVVQMDCPEDANTYIHRVGRTARYEKDGESLLVLLPTEEEAMIEQLQQKKIPVEKIKVNPKKFYNIQGKLESNLAADPELKTTAQRAFLGYLRSVFLMSNKKVFNVHKLDTDQYASSLGLAIPPRVRFLKKEEKRIAEKEIVKKEKADIKLQKIEKRDESDDDDSESDVEAFEDRLASPSENESESNSEENENSDIIPRQNRTQGKSDESASDSSDSEDERTKDSSPVLGFHVDDDDDNLFTVKRTVLSSDSESDESNKKSGSSKGNKPTKKEKTLTKYAIAKKLQKKNLQVNTKVLFDDEGEMVKDVLRKPQAELSESDDEGGINIEIAKQRMRKEDQLDKQLFRERIKLKHREERIQKKEKMRAKKRKAKPAEEDEDEEMMAVLSGEDEDDPLSYIPDPDKVYGPESEESGESDGSYEDRRKPKKRKMVSDYSNEEESDIREESEDENDSEIEDDEEDDSDDDDKDDRSEEDEVMDTGFGLEDDEAIALKLLAT